LRHLLVHEIQTIKACLTLRIEEVIDGHDMTALE
jgi:hypothetical protein